LGAEQIPAAGKAHRPLQFAAHRAGRHVPSKRWFPPEVEEEIAMKHGARNQLSGKVTGIQKGDIMSLIKFEVTAPANMASVITTESVGDLDLKVGDQVQLIVKAIHVLPIKP